MTKIKGTVKWFSNKKGFGFITPTSENAPTKEDIFVHQSNIVSDADYRTLKDGFEVEFEAITDENGKLKAQNVTGSDGKPCPGPDPKDRRGRRKKASKKAESGDEAEAAPAEGGDEKKSDEGGDEKNDNTNNKEGGKKGRNRRRRKNGAKKAAEGNNNDTTEGGASPEDKKPKQKNKEAKQSWYNDLDKSVQESLEKKEIKVDAGRAFLAIGDARIKLGTGGYAALAHATGILAEGKYTCDAQGKVGVTWENVLKHDTEWKVSTYEAEKASLLAEFTLTDDSVKPTGADETTETLWGEGKADPKEVLESNGFLMRKIALNSSQAGGRRGRGRRNKGKKGEATPAKPAAE